VQCDRARAASIEALRALGYAVSGAYEPVPGRTWIFAAEEATPKGTYRSSVSVECGDGKVTVALRQPPLGRRDRHFAADFRDQWLQILGRAPTGSSAGGESGPKEVMLTSPGASGLTVRMELLGPQEARERLGVDLGAARLKAAAFRVENSGSSAFIIAPRLLALERPGGEAVAPLRWPDASARLAQGGAGEGLYRRIQAELIEDQVLEPGARAAGYALYPEGEFRRASIVLVEKQSGRSVLLEAELPAQ